MVVLEVRTRQREELVDITGQVQKVVREAAVQEGVLHLWSMHTTCALTVNENADPAVPVDMAEKMNRLVPEGEGFYRHAEGNSDSHVKTSLFGPGLTLIIHDGRLVLGTWQGIFLAEWDGPRTRQVVAKIAP